MSNQDDLTISGARRVIGLADACELLSRAFRYPDEFLAEALVDNTFLADVNGCISDMGKPVLLDGDAHDGLVSLGLRDAHEVLDSMRKGFSILFLSPGEYTPVWPYEAPFQYAANRSEGAPILFRAPITLHVEEMMRGAGVIPQDSRREPVDSVWNEFSYLSYLYGKAAETKYEDDIGAADDYLHRAHSFVAEHAGTWIPQFLTKVLEESNRHSYGAEYALLAQAAIPLFGCVIADAAEE